MLKRRKRSPPVNAAWLGLRKALKSMGIQATTIPIVMILENRDFLLKDPAARLAVLNTPVRPGWALYIALFCGSESTS